MRRGDAPSSGGDFSGELQSFSPPSHTQQPLVSDQEGGPLRRESCRALPTIYRHDSGIQDYENPHPLGRNKSSSIRHFYKIDSFSEGFENPETSDKQESPSPPKPQPGKVSALRAMFENRASESVENNSLPKRKPRRSTNSSLIPHRVSQYERYSAQVDIQPVSQPENLPYSRRDKILVSPLVTQSRIVHENSPNCKEIHSPPPNPNHSSKINSTKNNNQENILNNIEIEEDVSLNRCILQLNDSRTIHMTETEMGIIEVISTADDTGSVPERVSLFGNHRVPRKILLHDDNGDICSDVVASTDDCDVNVEKSEMSQQERSVSPENEAEEKAMMELLRAQAEKSSKKKMSHEEVIVNGKKAAKEEEKKLIAEIEAENAAVMARINARAEEAARKKAAEDEFLLMMKIANDEEERKLLADIEVENAIIMGRINARVEETAKFRAKDEEIALARKLAAEEEERQLVAEIDAENAAVLARINARASETAKRKDILERASIARKEAAAEKERALEEKLNAERDIIMSRIDAREEERTLFALHVALANEKCASANREAELQEEVAEATMRKEEEEENAALKALRLKVAAKKTILNRLKASGGMIVNQNESDEDSQRRKANEAEKALIALRNEVMSEKVAAVQKKALEEKNALDALEKAVREASMKCSDNDTEVNTKKPNVQDIKNDEAVLFALAVAVEEKASATAQKKADDAKAAAIAAKKRAEEEEAALFALAVAVEEKTSLANEQTNKKMVGNNTQTIAPHSMKQLYLQAMRATDYSSLSQDTPKMDPNTVDVSEVKEVSCSNISNVNNEEDCGRVEDSASTGMLSIPIINRLDKPVICNQVPFPSTNNDEASGLSEQTLDNRNIVNCPTESENTNVLPPNINPPHSPENSTAVQLKSSDVDNSYVRRSSKSEIVDFPQKESSSDNHPWEETPPSIGVKSTVQSEKIQNNVNVGNEPQIKYSQEIMKYDPGEHGDTSTSSNNLTSSTDVKSMGQNDNIQNNLNGGTNPQKCAHEDMKCESGNQDSNSIGDTSTSSNLPLDVDMSKDQSCVNPRMLFADVLRDIPSHCVRNLKPASERNSHEADYDRPTSRKFNFADVVKDMSLSLSISSSKPGSRVTSLQRTDSMNFLKNSTLGMESPLMNSIMQSRFLADRDNDTRVESTWSDDDDL